MLTKTLEVLNQVVPVNVHPALTAMGMDTTILSRPLQLAGRLQHLGTQLETTDSGSVYFGNGRGNSDPFYHFSTLESCFSPDISQPVRNGRHRSRNFGDVPERGNSGGLSYEQRKVDPFCSTVASVADYLTELFNKGRSYHTVNIHRSAISAFHRPIDGLKVGQHDLVCRVLNAYFNVRPPQPRYVVTWDVDKVLSYIHSLGDNSSLSSKFLTLKLSMLLALASAGRSSDLRALDIRYMAVSDNSISFELGKLTKSRRRGQPPD